MPDNPEEIPEGAVVVYPKEIVQGMFGHAHPGSTRKEMSRRDVPAVTGYPVDEVHKALDSMDPRMAGWSRRPKKTRRK